MKKIASLMVMSILIIACKNEKKTEAQDAETKIAQTTPVQDEQQDTSSVKITPISHAAAVITWDKMVFYTDPVGGAKAFEENEKPDIILVTDIHGDHMSAETLQALKPGSAKIIVPKAVQEKLPEDLQANLVVMNNGDEQQINGFSIKAIPMYNLPQTKDAMHVKGRGNGYVIEKNGERLYIAGDTEDIPEMRDLKNIDIALIPMNLPYTMPVDKAAEAVLSFKPKKVIPYHYRGKDGFSDVQEFKRLVNEGNKNIEVELLEWYPEKSE